MLTGNLLRVKHHRTKVVPQYLNVLDPHWLGAAEDLIGLYRAAKNRTRGEIATDVLEIVGESNASLVPQGLAKLLDDRCGYEVVADRPPEDVREVAFRQSAIHRAAMAASGGTFDRDVVLQQTAAELSLPVEKLEPLFFADLKDEQRVLTFDDILPEQLLHRYNVALAQAVLLRSVGVEVTVWGESPARLRQLFRALRFRRLMASIFERANEAVAIRIDGPLSLFSATQKYGLQLAQFLPTLLHCKAFDLTASLRWGAERREKTFELSAADGLKTHAADYGVYVPKEFELFAVNFRNTVSNWHLDEEPAPIALPDGIWVPDFALTHTPTGRTVFLEMFGYWRRVDLQKHLARLNQHLPGQCLVAVSEQYRTDDDTEEPAGVVFYKRTPSAEVISKAAARIAGSSGL